MSGTISDLRQLRNDEMTILPGMTSTDVWNLSGGPVRVKTLLWSNRGKEVRFETANGALSKVVPSCQYIAVMIAADEAWTSSRLQILNADGGLRFQVPDEFLINGLARKCNFGWFTDAFLAAPEAFGIVVTVHRTRGDYDIHYQIDLDAETGRVLRVHEAR